MNRLRVPMCLLAALLVACGTPSPTPTIAPRIVPTISVPLNTPTPTPTRTVQTNDLGTRIALAAEAQVGVTTIYDPQYVRLAYPNGDVPIERGVCTDVVVRAFRGIGVDLQVRVHEDMAKNFSLYPKDWGLSAPDANIDHRRVQNLSKYFERLGKQVRNIADDGAFKPGDVVAWQLSGWMQHIGIVAVDVVPGTNRHYLIHNIGAGTQKEDVLRSYKILGNYRW
jgi:uncharacterized protein